MKNIIKKLIKLFCKIIIKKYQPDVIGIVGATHKTATKKILVQILQEKFRVRASVEGLGNKANLFLTIIDKEKYQKTFFEKIKIILRTIKLILIHNKNYPEVLVMELGTDKPGDLKFVTEAMSCQVGAVTSLKDMPLRLFKTAKKLEQEMRLLISGLSRDAYAVLNRDEEEVFAMAKKTDADVISFGFHAESGVRASDVSVKKSEVGESEGMYFKVTYNGSIVPMYLPNAKNEQCIYEALPAIAAALALGLNLVEISEALKSRA